MRIRKNALLLFAKYPEPGMVKTRLSILKDGLFSPEDAAKLFEAMLLDVVNVSLGAFARMEREGNSAGDMKRAYLEGTKAEAAEAHEGKLHIEDGVLEMYKLFISTAPEADVERMRELIVREFGEQVTEKINFIHDSGTSFDEHYNDAFDQVWDAGADNILSMGADMPAVTVYDIIRGFMSLHVLENEDNGGIVLAPDQEMGVSIVGWTAETEFDHTGVFYNQDGLTVLPAYIQKAREEKLPAIYLPPVPDVDTMADLAHNITLVEALDYCSHFDGNIAPSHTYAVLRDLGCDEVRVPPNTLHDPRDIIDG